MTRFGFLSTYPPTRCGLATFTQSLAEALSDSENRGPRVVRVLDEPSGQGEARFGRRIVARDLLAGDAASRAAAIRSLNGFDIVVVQHEYGIYGGEDGDEVLSVLEGLTGPSIVVLHTVLDTPTDRQRMILERVGKLATSLVVMSHRALENLARYDIALGKVRLIPHGVPQPARARQTRAQGQRVLTWGLIGPGKGIEWGIRAMAELGDMQPRPEYFVVGKTHPKVLDNEGETYRDGLETLVAELGLQSVVTFVDDYLDSVQLASYVASADVVLLPYDTRDQVTSGVLAEAVAAAKPVISTRFPHAVQLLSDGAGIIVDQQDPRAIADAVREILGDRDRAGDMAAAASRASAGTGWLEVAAEYRKLADGILAVHAA
jgi:glycosyltransferase involved in cell wall biosynthesis